MEQKVFSTREAEAKIGIKGNCPQNIRTAFNRIVKRLGLEPVATRKREGVSGCPEKLWSEEQINAIAAEYYARRKKPAQAVSSDETAQPVADNHEPITATEPAEVEGKKITPATKAAGQEPDKISHAKNTTNGGIPQQLGNLPAEILALKRFFPLAAKDDPPKGWNTPQNQKLAAEVFGKKKFIGFDISGHEQGTDYALIDFDHVRNPATGEFIYPEAEKWFNYIRQTFNDCYCELSQSEEGFHFLCRPTVGKFGMIANKEYKGVLYFDKAAGAKIEIFYKNAARYCMLTGNLFDCAAGAPVADEVAADEVLTNLLAVIVPPEIKAEPKETKARAELSADLQSLIDSINAVTPEQLMTKGYLLRSEKGAPYPTGFICPHCGSGTHTHKTGALTFYDNPNPHFACHACGNGGDVLKFLSKIYGIDNHGKEFFTLIRKAADDFALPYDPKIFEPKPAQMEPKQRDDFIWTQDRIKSCPVNLRLPKNYLFGKNGVELVVPAKKENAEPKYICATRTPIIPTKVFRNPTNNKIAYEFAILVFGEWAKVEVDGAVLGDRELTRILNGHGALIDKPPILNEFINAVIKLNADNLSILKSYNQTGWTSEEFEDFAFPANGKSVVRREGYDYERILKPRGDREAWKKKFTEVVAQGGAKAKTIIGFAGAAFLVRPLGLPNLQLHVHGSRSIGKTPIEQFAVSPFGNPTIHGLSFSFASTPKARLEMATAFRDFPMICEELESITKKEAEKIPSDVYQFFMGTSGQALKKDGTKREQKNFNGARLTSGEHSLVQSFGNSGEFKRVLELRCNSLLEEEFASDLYDFCAKNHGLFLEDWTRYIIEHKEQISRDYNLLLKFICAEQKDNGTEKDRTQLSTLVISSIAYQHFLVAIGLQSEIDYHEFEAVTKIVAAEMQSAEELDDTNRAAEELSSYVASHEKSFAHEKANGDEEPAFGATCHGIIYANGEVAFHPTELRRILQDELGFVSASKLIGEWRNKGKLIVNANRKDHVIKIGKKTYKAIHFKANVVATSVDSAEEHYYEDLGVL